MVLSRWNCNAVDDSVVQFEDLATRRRIEGTCRLINLIFSNIYNFKACINNNNCRVRVITFDKIKVFCISKVTGLFGR